MRLTVSTVIDRPPDVVWGFVAERHLENHARWDPHMELWPLTDGPTGLGTRYRRRHTHTDPPTEGVMEVVEWEPPSVLATHVSDVTPMGPMEIRGRMTLAAAGERSTTLTIDLDVPGVKAMDPAPVEASLAAIKALVEAESG